jgi:hypothetical protein
VGREIESRLFAKKRKTCVTFVLIFCYLLIGIHMYGTNIYGRVNVSNKTRLFFCKIHAYVSS